LSLHFNNIGRQFLNSSFLRSDGCCWFSLEIFLVFGFPLLLLTLSPTNKSGVLFFKLIFKIFFA